MVEVVQNAGLRSKGPDGGQSVEGGGDVGEDGTASGGLESLQLSAAPDVKVSEEEEEGEDGESGEEDGWTKGADDREE